MHRIIYSTLFYLAVPLVLIRLWLRSLRAPAYRRRINERFALQGMPASFDPARSVIWIHAVSVGETVAAAPLITALHEHYPETQILVTTMTPTGSDRVRALFGNQVINCYVPYDLPDAIQRFLDKTKPRLLILMETELWPNMIHYCHKRGVKLVLANARLSEKSAAGYRRFAGASATILGKLDCIAAQAEADGNRFIALGANRDAVKITGSLKFLVDLHADSGNSSPLFESIEYSQRPVLIAASTRDGEEEKVLTAFRHCLQTHPNLLLLLIPRHPERFDKVTRLCNEQGLAVIRRSSNEPVSVTTQVCVGDSMGEMSDYYRLATIAFVGGSLVNTGCQNVLEPAAMGIPVITGPSQFNFATICSQLEMAGALRTVTNERELAEFVVELLDNPDQQQVMGRSGKVLVEANQNALPALMQLLTKILPA